MIKENGDKVSAADKKELEEKVEALKKVSAQGGSASGGKDAGDAVAIKKAMDELNAVAQRVGTAMYASQKQESTKADSQQKEEKKEDNIKDADAEEVK